MVHNHRIINKTWEQKPDCTCGEKCLCCSAEKLTVNCGCGMEAKQFEFNLEHSCCHTEHDKKMSITAPSDRRSHPPSRLWRHVRSPNSISDGGDHEAAM